MSKITATITGFTFNYLGDKHAVTDANNVKVVEVFQWDALNEFFNDNLNLNIIEDTAIEEVPVDKRFKASIPLELVENATKHPGMTHIYQITGKISFEITGNYVPDDQGNYTHIDEEIS